ncbi:hypothetical protein BX285_2396 [Streptomyces sp. 1114.5]|uniref:hypothetical protein n=1 Tax=Streptomyces sp. 1114.5 TaxID=1938830 RepID=UPI000EB44D47|nr:hypothetical protein [Streptomyces sp. 1114.5]RKT17987.1 hypothetical protein BX285_2396 [Streptomyces sp. 1114.5]
MTWWLLDGQFSRMVRAVSPGRRAAHREVAQWCAEPGFLDGFRADLMWRVRRERSGVDDPLLGLSEEVLFRRIFGCDAEDGGATR